MLNSNNLDVSIIIVNYNTAKLLRECINSVYQKTDGLKYEIIVVDNASSDESVSIIKLEFPEVKLIESKTNLGFGNANNLGANYANGNFLFLLNTDTLLINNAIKVLCDFMRNDLNQNVGICGGNLFNMDLTPNHSYATSYPSLLNIFFYRSQIALGKTDVFNSTTNNKDVAIIIGADLFIRRYLYEEIGGFDPEFFMYVEDGDLSYRINKAGYRIVSVPDAHIIHYQGKSSTTANKLIMEVSSYIYYFKKHYSIHAMKTYKAIEFFFAIIKYIVFSILFKKDEKVAYRSLIKFLLYN